jgi:hypothetical protein
MNPCCWYRVQSKPEKPKVKNSRVRRRDRSRSPSRIGSHEIHSVLLEISYARGNFLSCLNITTAFERTCQSCLETCFDRDACKVWSRSCSLMVYSFIRNNFFRRSYAIPSHPSSHACRNLTFVQIDIHPSQAPSHQLFTIRLAAFRLALNLK